LRIAWPLKNKAPYVPPSRCKAVNFWYGSRTLQSPSSISGFQKELLEADMAILKEADYIISDDYMPDKVRKLFIEHVKRFKKILQYKPVKEI